MAALTATLVTLFVIAGVGVVTTSFPSTSSSNGNVGIRATLPSGVSVTNAYATNGTIWIGCKNASTVWLCSVPLTKDGKNLTTVLVVHNTLTTSVQVYTVSIVTKGGTVGTLIDIFPQTNPLLLAAGATANVYIVFKVNPTAPNGTPFGYNSTLY